VRDDATGRRVARIVELEAYIGEDDKASHARFGRTARNRVMFGPPGIAYVYLVYGMYDCLNVVTEADGRAAALLVRAAEPLDGLARMRADRLATDRRRRRSRTAEGEAAARRRLERTPDPNLASGPGRLAAAFGIDTTWTGTDLCDPRSPLRLEYDPSLDAVADDTIATTPRVGVAYAGPEWAARPWRFVVSGHPSISGPRAAG
jgi:DNA-3-methyladenine glycosylase